MRNRLSDGQGLLAIKSVSYSFLLYLPAIALDFIAEVLAHLFLEALESHLLTKAVRYLQIQDRRNPYPGQPMVLLQEIARN